VRYEVQLPDSLEAPVQIGDFAGTMEVYIDDTLYCSEVLYVGGTVRKIDYRYVFYSVLRKYFLFSNT
jgi:hypothetical protein